VSPKAKWVWAITAGAAVVVVAQVYFSLLLFFALAAIAPVVNPMPLVAALAVGIALSGSGLGWAFRKPRRIVAGAVNALLLALQCCFVGALLWPSIAASKETVILPDGFTGRVEIIHGVLGAEPLEHSRSGAVVYRIPPTGLLLTQDDDPRQGWFRRQYFYQKTGGALEPITPSWPTSIHETDPDFLAPTVGIYMETGTGYMEIENGQCAFATQGFMVGSKQFIRSIEGGDDMERMISGAGLTCARAKRTPARSRPTDGR
jgi:uncharacterized protein DUF6843